ncbi:MAG: acetylxylan esterase [Rhodothermales bacterium]
MNIRFLLLAGLLVAGAPAASRAQSHNHLDRVNTPVAYATRAAWDAHAGWLRDQLLVGSGLYPMPDKTPLRPVTSEFTLGDGYTVQSIGLETYPGFYLTGTLYRPRAGTGPFPAILSPHGHWDEGRFEHTDLASIPGRAITFARQGYVVLSYSMIGYNENSKDFPHRFDEMKYQLWGFSAMGLQLWNSLRALDYLSSLPEVDANRIGMTGASGGGTQTFMLTAIDDRIAAAAPVNMISAHFQGGCICENGPLTRLDDNNIEIGALAAPRPLMMVSTAGDWTVNTPKVEYPAMQAIYRLFDAEDRVANVHLNYPHNYNKESRSAVYDWFARWLTPEFGDVPEADELNLLPADTREIKLPRRTPTPEALFAQVKTGAERQLSHAKPTDAASLDAYRATYGRALEHVLFAPPEPGQVQLDYLAPSPAAPARRAVLIVHPGTPASERTARSLARQQQIDGRLAALLVPYPEGDTFVPPDSIAYWTTYNATVPVKRVQEIRRAIETLSARPGIENVEVIGLDEAGVWTLLARAMAPDVAATTVHLNGVAYDTDDDFLAHLPVPLLRRAGDLRTAVALIAPAPLTITHLPDGALADWIRDLYAALGAEQALHLSATD